MSVVGTSLSDLSLSGFFHLIRRNIVWNKRNWILPERRQHL
jgi:hypothetical protein